MAKRLSPKEISDLYAEIPRISQERNDFLLPQINDFVSERRWINTRPEYQRRLVWDNAKKSRLIESLLMNVPIPPVFLYEHELSRYEVMDGQQRINAVMEFYNNDLKLKGLTTWSALNGLTYSKCPEVIRRGLDRRRISAIVLLTESTDDSPEAVTRIRQEVFERLNTGGLVLKHQELRNSMYAGAFNNLIVELAGDDLFDDIFGIPRYSEHYDKETGFIGSDLSENTYFKRMKDCEIVLRFFALRNSSNIKGSVRRILDRCMLENVNSTEAKIQTYREDFIHALKTAHAIFGNNTFKIKVKGKWRLSEPLYDGVMVAVDKLSSDRNRLIKSKLAVRAALADLLSDPDSEAYELVVGRPNTAAAIKGRLKIIRETLQGAVK